MISYMLSLPFRKATSQDLSVAIRQYISSKYNQHPDMFREDFTIIDTLREDAINVVEPHVSSVKKIVAYTSQLVWIARKFPNDIGVEFTWYPALGYNKERVVSLDNLKYEQASVLYNLAALYSQLAISSNRSTTEGLKLVCNYFCLAAGVIGHIQKSIIPEMQINPPVDLDSSTLECLKQLMLAQAQECFWRKAVMDRIRDSSIAKLAAKTSDLYGVAGDWGIKSETISSEWIHFAIAKHHHFAAAAQYRQACECLEKKRYGEEVARLRDSVACAKEGLREAKYLNKLVLEDLNSLKAKATEDLKRAEKDNDMIYLCAVPPKTELKNLDRVVMAVPKEPLEVSEPLSFLGEKAEFGRPLFAKLVPFAVHIAASIFEQRLERIVNNSIIDPLEALTSKIYSILSSLSLPGSLQALEKPLGLPPTLVSHAAEIRQTDAITRLQRSFSDTSSLAQSCALIYAEASSILVSERTEDEKLRAKYGTDRWSRLDSALAAPKLYKRLDEIDGYLKTAANSDHLIHKTFQTCKDLLYVLSSSDHNISKFVPNACSVVMSPMLEKQKLKLRNSLNELTRLESRRRKTIESIRNKAKKDDINPDILEEAARLEHSYPAQSLQPAHFEDFIEARLSKYDAYIFALKNEEEEQSSLIERLEESNKDFLKCRNEDSNTSREREKALQDLEDAYFQYKEIVSNLESGRKFYNDLGRIVGKFRDDAKIWVAERREEAIEIEREIKIDQVQPVSKTQYHLQEGIQNHPANKNFRIQPRNHFSLQSDVVSEEQQKSKSPPPKMKKIPTEPVISVWNPSMGINFAGPAADFKDESALEKLDDDDDDDVIQKTDESDSEINTDYKERESGRHIIDSDTHRKNTKGNINNHTWDPEQGLRFC